MSLIYEALRKSEEQRRLGVAPTLSTPTVFAVRRRRRAWPVAAALAALVAVGIAAWWLGRASLEDDTSDARVASAATSDAPATSAALPAAPPPVDEMPAATPAMPVPPPTAPAGAAPATAPAEDAATREGLAPDLQRKLDRGEVFANSPELLKPAPPTPAPPYVPPEAALPQPLPDAENATIDPGAPATAMAAPPPAAPPVPAQVIPLPDGAAPAADTPAPAPPEPVATAPAPAVANVPAPGTAPAAPAVASAPAAGAVVPYVFELPLATRRELPALKLNMHVYSADRARRFVIVDGTRAGEGGTLTGDVAVVEIRSDDVILEFRGMRFLLPRGG